MRAVLAAVFLSLAALSAHAQVAPPTMAQTLRHRLLYAEPAGLAAGGVTLLESEFGKLAGAGILGASVGTLVMVGALSSVEEMLDRDQYGDDSHDEAYLLYATIVLPWVGSTAGVMLASQDDVFYEAGPFTAVGLSSLMGSLIGLGAGASIGGDHEFVRWASFALGAGVGAVGGYYALDFERSQRARGLVLLGDGRWSLANPVRWITYSLRSRRLSLVTMRW